MNVWISKRKSIEIRKRNGRKELVAENMEGSGGCNLVALLLYKYTFNIGIFKFNLHKLPYF